MARKPTHPPDNLPETPLKPLLDQDPCLEPYAEAIARRMDKLQRQERRLTGAGGSLTDFASGHLYFGLHRCEGGWVLREWAPHAEKVYMVGSMTRWREDPAYALRRLSAEGIWELRLAPASVAHGDLYRLRVHWPGGEGDRIPAWARRVVQDPRTLIFNAQAWDPPSAYRFRHAGFRVPPGPRFVYEAHVGMAQEERKVGSFAEFTASLLPRIVAAGYDTLQLMAVQEHPYYGSFGYQVSSFFAPSSRFGTPEDLKALVDAAHGLGLTVLMDLVHSHAVNNEVEGLSRFDGTDYQYFHAGPRGRHPAWDSRCFDYGKPQVLHFLLSNCRYWLEEYGFDGFRFDGVTSMLYRHHGLNRHFTGYADYFGDDVDEDALVYLALANRLVHTLRPDAVTVAEDVSGMPALAAPSRRGGTGFDYRFAMGIPDFWIRLAKDLRDEDWPMGRLWFELTNRRREEKTISYAESHDQAIVGDQTLIFRLIGDRIYGHMRLEDDDLAVERGLALHKLIRLITLATAGGGYLTFMGNEFGHPEWIDFPREGNRWSYAYARRQWRLADDPALKFRFLGLFDRDMIAYARRAALLEGGGPILTHEHETDKVIAFERGGALFAFNFHPHRSHVGYRVGAPAGEYRVALDSDDSAYGGHGRVDPRRRHFTRPWAASVFPGHQLSLYLPSRTALVLEKIG